LVAKSTDILIGLSRHQLDFATIGQATIRLEDIGQGNNWVGLAIRPVVAFALILLVFCLGQHHLDKLLVVDVTLGVLLAVYEPLDLLLSHLLAQGGQHVTQLGG
jgi:hypothetical protein